MVAMNKLSLCETADALDILLVIDPKDEEALQEALKLYFSSPRDQCPGHQIEEDYYTDQGLLITEQ
jgi:hypothetical protein